MRSSTPPILPHGPGRGATRGLVLQPMADDPNMRLPERCSWSMDPARDNIGLSIKVPAADGQMRFWRNTSIARLHPGQRQLCRGNARL